MKCEICNQGPPNGPTIHRVNKPGEMPARWRCVEHLTSDQSQAIDPVIKDIVETIQQADWSTIVKETPKTNAAILEAAQYYQPLYPSINGRNQAVHAVFAKEMETDAREFKLELARSLERETALRNALSLARQYIAGEFGFENWRIEKIDAILNVDKASAEAARRSVCGESAQK